MIDDTNTSPEWQVHTGDVCVLPVGALEQHAAHLPLATDTILAEAYGRMIAEELDAALLPALPFASSLEHTGFRGSVSLRPETLMQIVRDIADEVERQNFCFLIIANGHGGNFALQPVARDINRMDRPLKILLVNGWEFCDSDAVKGGGKRGMEIHAGESETSLMLAIRPDLVRPGAKDTPPVAEEPLPLRRQDLTTFGVGHFSAHGVIGRPSRADKGKGDALLAAMRRAMVDIVRDRIERLRRQPRYAGPGPA